MKPQEKPRGDPSGSELGMPEDTEARIWRFLDALDGAPDDFEEVLSDQIRLLLARAVIIREYDRVDADTTQVRTVTVDYVVEERGHEVTDIDHFYDDQCMRITFNEDPNDFVQAYFTLDLAMAASRCNDLV